MSTAAAAERPEGSGFIAWLAHHEWVIYLGLVAQAVIYLVDIVMKAATRDGLPYPVVLFFAMLGCASIITNLFVSRHFYKLCSGCMAAMPLNGSELAQERARTLRLYHAPWIFQAWLQRRVGGGWRRGLAAYMLCVMILLIGITQLSTWVFGEIRIGNLIVVLLTVSSGLLAVRHRPLIPWCKWCQDDHRGPREPSPEPPPVPVISPDPSKVGV